MNLCQKIPAADVLVVPRGGRGGQEPDSDRVCACADQGCPTWTREMGSVKDSEEDTQLLPSLVWGLQSCVLLELVAGFVVQYLR